MNITERQPAEEEHGPSALDVMNMLNHKEVDVAIEALSENLEKMKVEDEDPYMMLNTDHTIQDDLYKEDMQKMMYEDDRHWNMEEISQWNDEYTIHLTGEEIEQHSVDEEDEEATMLTSLECDPSEDSWSKKQRKNQKYSASLAPGNTA